MASHYEVETVRLRQLASLGEIVSGIMHEIRNPLGGIELYASLIHDRYDGEVSRMAGEILHAVQRVQTTIARLLSFAAESRLVSEPLPVGRLLHEVTQVTLPLLHNDKWRLVLTIEPGLPPLHGDRILLTQALTNLVTNALEAMPEGGQVTIRAQKTRQFDTVVTGTDVVELRVEDEGPGITTADREHIFTPFFTTKRTGTGLGLALAYKIITAHGGAIHVSTVPIRGSCFSVLLPVAEGANLIPQLAAPLTDAIQNLQTEKVHEETRCYS
jgi:signal transduction histidine kinase